MAAILITFTSSLTFADIKVAQISFQKKHYDITLKEIRKELGTKPEAQFLMAKMYEKGLGVVQNSHLAIKWYARAASSGHLESSYALGSLFESGATLPKNYRESRQWYQRSANQGHTDSQVKLGAMLNEGRGGKKNKTEGLAWLSLAQESGSKSAKALLDAHTLKASEKASIKERKQQLLTTIKNKITSNKGKAQ